MWNFIFGVLLGCVIYSTMADAQLFPLPPAHNPNDSEAIRSMKQSWYDKAVTDYAMQQLNQPCER